MPDARVQAAGGGMSQLVILVAASWREHYGLVRKSMAATRFTVSAATGSSLFCIAYLLIQLAVARQV